MKFTSSQKKIDFDPVTVRITIESAEELRVLKEFTNHTSPNSLYELANKKLKLSPESREVHVRACSAFISGLGSQLRRWGEITG